MPRSGDEPTAPARLHRFLVAGTAGGVGTTTVAALLFAHLAKSGHPPIPIDRTAGSLAERLPPTAGDLDQRLRVHDLGGHAATALTQLSNQTSHAVLVSAATPLGCDLALAELRRSAGREVDEVADRGSGTGDQRVVIVLADVFGTRRLGRQMITALQAAPGVRGVVRLRRDHALAAADRINAKNLSRRTTAAIGELATLLDATSQGWSMPSRPKRQSSPPMDWSHEIKTR
ncbi:MAG: hypothetical protein L0G99_01220 [Propionibacteriales bacterium]|nr:hypothetical protein [Propionibacteriales bacterium]